MDAFELDGRLARDSELLASLSLSDLRLQKDSRFPWLVLVPRVNGMSEVFDLTLADREILHHEILRVAEALKALTGATKINIGALGNIVRQLHVHIIARFEDDAAWPGPVWGFGQASTYDEEKKQEFISRLLKALAP